jgi:hypothetical protein
MWLILEVFVCIVLGLGLILEVVVPVLFDKPIFPSFRSKPIVEEKKVSPTKDLEDMVDELKTKVEQEQTETETVINETEISLKEKKEKLEKVQELKTKTTNL